MYLPHTAVVERNDSTGLSDRWTVQIAALPCRFAPGRVTRATTAATVIIPARFDVAAGDRLREVRDLSGRLVGQYLRIVGMREGQGGAPHEARCVGLGGALA